VTSMKERQVHILLGCADARDLSRIYIQALLQTIQDYETQGIEVSFHKVRTPGSFATASAIADIRGILDEEQRIGDSSIPVSFHIHIQAHGEIANCQENRFVYLTHDVEIKQGSALNCGMLHATQVALELEKLLLQEQPTVTLPGDRHITLKDEQDIRTLLREVYAYNGYMAGDWVSSIDDLRTHPRKQRALLEDAIRNDSTLKNLNIQITANIKDYQQHALVRVDGGSPEVPFWSDFYTHLQALANSEGKTGDLARAQNAKQDPLAGLICTTPHLSSRFLAKQFYVESKGLKASDTIANTIFKLRGITFDMPKVPFGPYTIVGYFYGVKHLGLTDQIVMGNDDEQTQRILQKLSQDPLMKFITDHFKVNLIPVSHKELQSRHADLPYPMADYESKLFEHERRLSDKQFSKV
jgi:hypothetical protein